MNPTLFIYPWLNTGAEAVWDLRFSMRSLGLFQGPHQVLVIGDKPSFGARGLWHMAHERQASDFFPRALDVNRKMERVLQCPWVGEEFVHIHDDQVLLVPVGMDTLRRRVARNECQHGAEGYTGLEKYGGSVKHTRLVHRTVEALRAAGINRVWNYETHMPRVCNTQKMREVFERFKPTENRLLYSTLYYNWVFPNQPPDELLGRLDNVKAAFYGEAHDDGYSVPRHEALTAEQVTARMRGKWLLNYNAAGRTPLLTTLIKQMFPEPGRFESVTNAPQHLLRIHA